MSDLAVAFHPGRAVRVQRSGNSKVLPVPAEVSREAHIEIGEEYVLEVQGADLFYRAAGAPVSLVGSGSDRIGVFSADQILAAPQRASVRPLDWDV